MNLASRLLNEVEAGLSIGGEDAEALLASFLGGGVTGEEFGALLRALQRRPPRAEELSAFAGALRKRALPFVSPRTKDAIDVCGTGGDGSGVFNVSTAVALLVASMGVPVLKHGNRGVSSASGSADALEHLKIMLPADAHEAQKAFDRDGFTFLFAPYFHPAFAKIAPVRKSVQGKTLFNLLGPLLNPGLPPYQLIGTSTLESAIAIAEALLQLGTVRALVVHSEDGLDELSPASRARSFLVEGDEVRPIAMEPSEWGIRGGALGPAKVSGPAQSASLIERIFAGRETGTPLELVLFNAGAALWIAGRAKTGVEGVRMAREHLGKGEGLRFLRRLQGEKG